MTLTFRDVKGSNLTAAEVDENFRDVDGRITTMEENPPEAVSIDVIEVSGSTMTIVLTDASEQGPFELPVAVPRPSITETIATSSLTLSVSKASHYMRCTHASGCVVTVPDDPAIVIDNEFTFVQRGAAAVSFVEENTDVVVNVPVGFSPNTAGVGAVVTLKKVGETEFDLFGLLLEEEATA